ncbi:MAG: hypothetical protein ABID45_02250 [Patescibacteria group bacterium]
MAAPIQEKKEPIPKIERLDGQDLDAVKAQLSFENVVGYSKPGIKWVEDTTPIRAEQIKNKELALCVVKEDGEVVASTEIVLKSGTKGKIIEDNEAWASGTLIREDKRGIGKFLAAEQERIAKEAGKDVMRTAIWLDNFASSRMRLREGFRLDDCYPDKDRPDAHFRKNLENPPSKKMNLAEERQAGRLPIVTEVNDSSTERFLIHYSQANLIKQAIDHGHKGIFLLIPKDVPEDTEIKGNNDNYYVFVKAETLSEKQ